MKKLVLAIVVIVSMSGCTFIQSSTPLNYQYYGNSNVQFTNSVLLEVKKFRDLRDVANDKVIFQKRNQYGKTSGSYLAEKPFAEIVRDAVITGLRESGATIAYGDANFRLEGELQENDYNVQAGLWKGTVTNTIRLKLRLIDTGSNAMIWQDTLVGKATDKTAWGTANFLLDIAKDSIDDLVDEILKDDYFRQALNN